MKKFTLILLSLFVILFFTACTTGMEDRATPEGTDAGNTLKEVAQSPLPTEIRAEATQPIQTAKEKKSVSNIIITIKKEKFELVLEKNAAAEEFAKRLPLQLNMEELNGNEKFFNLKVSLPTNPKAVKNIATGDLMLYGDNCLVLFYEDFSTNYSYTPIGKIANAQSLEEALGAGDAEVEFSIA